MKEHMMTEMEERAWLSAFGSGCATGNLIPFVAHLAAVAVYVLREEKSEPTYEQAAELLNYMLKKNKLEEGTEPEMERQIFAAAFVDYIGKNDNPAVGSLNGAQLRKNAMLHAVRMQTAYQRMLRETKDQ